MSTIKKLILKDVRCFEGKQEFNIRPLTFLVGENSTGKSTVLACLQILSNFLQERDLDFNTVPYQMGAYMDIARKVGGRGGRSKSFDLGFELQVYAKETIHLLATLIERESGSEPTIQQLKIEFKDVIVIVESASSDKEKQTGSRLHSFSGPNKSTSENEKPVFTFKARDEHSIFFVFNFFMFYDTDNKMEKDHKELDKLLRNILSRLGDRESPLFDAEFNLLFPPYHGIRFESFAPIRSKPMRTYDPVREVKDPAGSGMPMTLMNMYRNDKKKWENLREKLIQFGKASGLFDDIAIKTHGRAVNNPFQLQVKSKGIKTNIVDVGYGVSQILPILVRIITASKKTTFLVQQPEVHLHPKGQAALVTLMLEIKNKRENSFIVETHSEYMINRAKIEIMNGNINHEDVSVIYLESKGNKVKIHNITFDKNADMTNVPDEYNKFFMQETNKLLGFGD